jgi:type I restriction enzyme, S subunit
MSKIDDLINELCPNGVEYKSIGEVADCTAGATPSSGISEYWEGGTIPWMSSGEVNKGTIYDTDKKITQTGYDSCGTKMLPPNVVVMALAGQGKTRGLVARTRIALCTNQSLAAIKPDERVDSDFLYHFLQTQYQKLRNASSGDGSRGGLNLQIIRNYKIPIPPLKVQHEIVNILDEFTSLEVELKSVLGSELKARRKQYEYYRDEFLSFEGDKKVEWTPLGKVGKFIRGKRFTKADYEDSGVDAIHYGDIYTYYGTSADTVISHVRSELKPKLRFAKPGDVIITDVGETVDDVGKAVAWMGANEVAIHDHCYAFRHTMNPKFVAYYMQTSRFRTDKAKYVARTKVKTLLINGLEKVSIPVPSTAEQNRIVSILDTFDMVVNDVSKVLPAEIKTRYKQYEYYRSKLLAFQELPA